MKRKAESISTKQLTWNHPNTTLANQVPSILGIRSWTNISQVLNWVTNWTANQFILSTMIEALTSSTMANRRISVSRSNKNNTSASNTLTESPTSSVVKNSKSIRPSITQTANQPPAMKTVTLQIQWQWIGLSSAHLKKRNECTRICRRMKYYTLAQMRLSMIIRALARKTSERHFTAKNATSKSMKAILTTARSSPCWLRNTRLGSCYPSDQTIWKLYGKRTMATMVI